MKFTLSWLKDHLETDATLDEIVATLTKTVLRSSKSMTGSSPQGFRHRPRHRGEAHPNADGCGFVLSMPEGPPSAVVCGAPNARPA